MLSGAWAPAVVCNVYGYLIDSAVMQTIIMVPSRSQDVFR